MCYNHKNSIGHIYFDCQVLRRLTKEMRWDWDMAKTSQQQKRIREYNDEPLSPDFSKTDDEFVDHLMKQLPPLLPEIEKDDKDRS